MASTIIIKNGAGSSVPSSLKQGEFAINVDNGFLYYGTSGSSNTVSSGWQFGAVTSSGDVSASGDLAGNSLTIKDAGVSKTSIDASGNITSVATIQGEHIHSTDDISVLDGGKYNVDGAGGDTYITNGGNNNTINLVANDTVIQSTTLTGISVLGNVSSSAKLAGTNLDIRTAGVQKASIDTSGNITANTISTESDIQHVGDTNNKISFGTDTQDFQTGGSSRLDISDSGVRLGGANSRVTTILDEDNMASDSATSLATQQSIKAYVDANAGGGSVSGNTFATDLKIGRDADNLIDFTTDNQVTFRVSANDGVVMKASGEIEATSLDISGDVDVDGTLETDALSIASTTVSSTAAELNLVDGSSAGTIVNSKAVIYGSSGEVNATTLQIGGNAITSTAAELNVTDGVTAGTVAASKAVVVDSNKDIASFRNITLTGELDAGSLDISGDADIDGTLEADAITINGTSLSDTIAGTTVALATRATNADHVLITDNENTNEENQITFIEGAGGGGANRGLEADGDLTYNPSTGTVSATIFKGNIDAVDGDFDGTLEADALTIGGTNILTGGIVTTLGAISSDFTLAEEVSFDARLGTVVLSSANMKTIVQGAASNVDIGAFELRAQTFQSDVATGTAPFTVASTTQVANLNAATAGTAAVATTVTITDNENTDENNAIIFTAGGDVDGGNIGLESDGDLTYNPSSGTISTTNLTASANLHIDGTGSFAMVTASRVYDDTYYSWEVSARVDADDDTNWQGPAAKGILGHEDWQQDYGTDYDDGTNNPVLSNASRLYVNTGWWLSPAANFSASLKSMEIWVQPNTNAPSGHTSGQYAVDTGFSCSLWYSKNSDLITEINQLGSNAGNVTQRHAGSVDSSQFKDYTSDRLFKYNNYLVTQSLDIVLAPGSWIYPRFKNFGTSLAIYNIYWKVNYCKKPI